LSSDGPDLSFRKVIFVYRSVGDQGVKISAFTELMKQDKESVSPRSAQLRGRLRSPPCR
jgi:hypothetical protein